MIERTKLRELVELQRGQSYKGTLLGEPGPVLLGLGTINRNGGFRADKLKTYGCQSSPKILLGPGDLYVSLKDVTHAADLLGAVARVPESIEIGRLTQDTVRLEIKSRSVNNDYLYWALQTPEYRSYCRLRGTGTTNLDLSRNDFLEFTIRLPETREQQAIAEVLGALDDKIAANAKLVATTQELLGSLLHGRATTIALGEIVDHRKRTIDVSGVAAPTVYHFSLPAFDKSEMPDVANPTSIMSSKFLVEEPSVLISKLNPRTPRIWDIQEIPDELALASTEFLVLQPRYSSTTVLWAILSQPAFTSRLAGKVSGTSGSHQRVKPGDLLATETIDPRLIDVGLQITMTALGKRAQSARLENQTLAESRDALLPQLMSGKLRVRDAEKAVEAVV